MGKGGAVVWHSARQPCEQRRHCSMLLRCQPSLGFVCKTVNMAVCLPFVAGLTL